MDGLSSKKCPVADGEGKKGGREGDDGKPWAFITNHAAVLALLFHHPRITAREISHEVGITERSVRIIISDLDKSGYIRKMREGRGVRYLVDFKRPMRHRTQRDVAVKHLLSLLSAGVTGGGTNKG